MFRVIIGAVIVLGLLFALTLMANEGSTTCGGNCRCCNIADNCNDKEKAEA